MTEKTFQSAVKYGGIALGCCAVLNIWIVLKHVEVYRDSARSEAQFQQNLLQLQTLQGVVQEFSTHANSDPHIAEIFKKAQAMGSPTAGLNQPMAPRP